MEEHVYEPKRRKKHLMVVRVNENGVYRYYQYGESNWRVDPSELNEKYCKVVKYIN